jgi:hypothetical protein
MCRAVDVRPWQQSRRRANLQGKRESARVQPRGCARLFASTTQPFHQNYAIDSWRTKSLERSVRRCWREVLALFEKPTRTDRVMTIVLDALNHALTIAASEAVAGVRLLNSPNALTPRYRLNNAKA